METGNIRSASIQAEWLSLEDGVFSTSLQPRGNLSLLLPSSDGSEHDVLCRTHNGLEFCPPKVKSHPTDSTPGFLSQKVDDQSIEVDLIEGVLRVKNGGITTEKIANGAITTDILGDNAIGSSKIADGAVTTEKLVNSAVTSTKIASSAVTEAKIADNAVTASKIRSNAVTSVKIASGAVTTEKIADGAVTGFKLEDSAVLLGKIAAGAVDELALAANSVTTAKIANNAVTADKISSQSLKAIANLPASTNPNQMIVGGPSGWTVVHYRFEQQFTNANLDTAGNISITHNLGVKYAHVTIYDEQDLIVIPDEVRAVNQNSLILTLAALRPLSGTWTVVVSR
jgi:hypothetical protein